MWPPSHTPPACVGLHHDIFFSPSSRNAVQASQVLPDHVILRRTGPGSPPGGIGPEPQPVEVAGPYHLPFFFRAPWKYHRPRAGNPKSQPVFEDRLEGGALEDLRLPGDALLPQCFILFLVSLFGDHVRSPTFFALRVKSGSENLPPPGNVGGLLQFHRKPSLRFRGVGCR